MKLRTCRDSHFIAAIKGGFVTKFLNVDSRRKPALVFKSLSDIYESEDAKRVASHSTSAPQDENFHSAFNLKRVKSEGSCLPMVDRTLREVEQETRSFVSHDDDDDETKSDSDDSRMTLKQLKERRRTKKRKLPSIMNSNLKKVCGEESQSGEDDCDLMETLNSLKSKLPKKKSKGRRKCTNKSVFNSELALSIKSEPIIFSANSMEANWGLMSLIHVKSEDPEPEFLGFPNPLAIIDGLGFEDISDEILETNEYHNRLLVFPEEQYPESSLINVSCDSSGEDMEIDQYNNCQRTLYAEEYQNCSVNEVSYDHLEHLEPIALLQENTELDTEENSSYQLSQESSMEITSTAMDQSSRMCPYSDNSHSPEILRKTKYASAVEALDREADLKNETSNKLSQIGSFSSPKQSSHSSTPSQTCFSPDDDFVLVKDNTACSSSDASKDNLNPGNHSVSGEDDSLVYRTQPPVPTITNSEKSSSPGIQDSGGANASSDPVLLQTPERLPSRRKAISPTSQEQLRTAMKYDELYDDADYYKCKEKLYFGKQTEIKPPTVGSRSPPASKAESSIQSRKLNRRKVMISPNQILKMSRNEKRGSPPKGNLDGPRISRSIPHFSTECNSVKRCSESAITFSQRQMLDFESLADRLVNELQSMKDIVEQKLLFESYRNPSLKNDADEVKTAIKNATKVEETTRKWLSVMGRDCHRFCKIMRLTKNGPPASENEVRRERKKISFADEAGGTLCHVKFFENGPTSPESPLTKQKDQIEALNN